MRIRVLLFVVVFVVPSSVSAVTRYVDLASSTPNAPYTDWASAATNIQDAIDVAASGDEIVVADGIYSARQSGTQVTVNCVAVNRPMVVRSLHGPATALICGSKSPGGTNGNGAIRCAWLAAGAVLSGFTLTNGATIVSYNYFERSGGGAYCASAGAILTNCVLVGNSATDGGAAYSGTLKNCVVMRNLAERYGAGTFLSTLVDCTLIENAAVSAGGGAHASLLTNCTLIGNSALYGGGAYYGTLSNCSLAGNSADNGGGAGSATLLNCWLKGNGATNSGGAAYVSTLWNCVASGNVARFGAGVFRCNVESSCVTSNRASGSGGGAYEGNLNNCTLTGNRADATGGGAYQATLGNCILWLNTAASLGDNYQFGSLSHCCTAPLPASGHGNLTNDPNFVALTNGDLHLRADSPCINAGLNLYSLAPTDLEGNPRNAAGTVDVGAYEFPNARSVLSYAWLQFYCLTNDGSADYLDPDSDGMNNWQEWVADTDPTNAASILKLLTPRAGLPTVTLSWPASSDRSYLVEQATNLTGPVFYCIASNITGRAPVTSYTNREAPVPGPSLYRVRVQAR